jgi:hypothetical protein
MKNRFFLSGLALGAIMFTLVGPALAAEPPVIGGGPGVYKVNGNDDVANVGCGDLLNFVIRVHNTASTGEPSDESTAQNVVVKATLPSGQVSSFTSTATITSSNAATVTDTVTVNLASPATIEFVSGPAGITAGGAAIGDVKKLAQPSFQAKVVCPAPAAVVTPTPPPGRGAAPAPVAVAKPQPLAQTGPEDGLLLGALLTSLLGLTWVLTRPQKRRIPVKK